MLLLCPVQELAEVLSIRDTWLPHRMSMLLQGNRRAGSPRNGSPSNGLSRPMFHSMHDWRRFACLRCLVALADSHEEARSSFCFFLSARSVSCLPGS